MITPDEKYTRNYAQPFIDREVQHPLTYDMKNNSTDETINVTLTPTPGQVVTQGTPFNQTTMQTGLQGGLLDLIYPIGRGFIDFTDTDYSGYLGFTWERELIGMMPIGCNPNDSAFDTIGKIGGSKTKTIAKANLPNYTLYNANHTHGITDSGHEHDVYSIDNGSEYFGGYVSRATNGSNKGTNWGKTNKKPTGITINNANIRVDSGGSGQALNVMNPYKVVAYWKRVA